VQAIIKLNDLKKNLQHSYKSLNTNVFYQHDIKMAIINIFEKIDSFKVMQHGFGPVDYDHTQMLAKVL
jgi:hypothetical protein